MSAQSRRVNQQLLFVRQLMQLATADSIQPSLLQAVYLQCELAVLYYFFEIFDNSKLEQVFGETQFFHLSQVVDRQGLLDGIPTRESRELRDLLANPSSWLGTLIMRLRDLRLVKVPFSRNEGLKHSIFDTVEDSDQLSGSNLIAAENIAISNENEGPSLAELDHIIGSFAELVSRHRTVGEEY